jgi:hypothetical protein
MVPAAKASAIREHSSTMDAHLHADIMTTKLAISQFAPQTPVVHLNLT